MNTETIDTGQISDGYHTFNELYEHRTLLFLLVMKIYPHLSWWSYKQQDGQEFDGYFIAGMTLPTGQITYHLQNKYVKMLNRKVPYLDVAPLWDGHTSQDVISRLSAFLS